MDERPLAGEQSVNRNGTLPLADKDFRTVMINILKDLMGNMSMTRREREDRKKNQIELLDMKNKISEVKISLDGINSRFDTTEEMICDLDVRDIEII